MFRFSRICGTLRRHIIKSCNTFYSDHLSNHGHIRKNMLSFLIKRFTKFYQMHYIWPKLIIWKNRMKRNIISYLLVLKYVRVFKVTYTRICRFFFCHRYLMRVIAALKVVITDLRHLKPYGSLPMLSILDRYHSLSRRWLSTFLSACCWFS